ncbi:MAG TPA: MFS transporter [Acetobacteraceae bacterium]|jgi:AAHS family 4-hydroxybenzoate transporter-like MFS transporter
MSAATTIDVSAAIEHQQLNGFLVRLVAVSWIITFFDGFDQNVISFAAPAIAPMYHLTRPMMGNVFSIGLVGTMIGGFLFGWIGDRFGRRPAVIIATLLFAAMTLGFALVGSYGGFLAMRLAVGIGTGGMLPLSWALNIEYAPRRWRSSIVTVVMLGYSAGISLGGPIAVWLIPRFGWQSVFVFGGVLSLVAAAALSVTLPESIRFMVARQQDGKKIAGILRRIVPHRVVPHNARFVMRDEDSLARDFSPRLLFGGALRWITPMLWVAYIFSSMAVFFLATWTPLVFEALAYSRPEAAAAGSITAVAGALGGLALMRFTDNFGAIAVAAMPALAIPLLLLGGFTDVGHAGFLVLIGLTAFALIGGHFGLHSIAGIFYPSAWRGNGAGWATSVAKVGSIAGPFLGGLLLSTSLPVRQIFALMAVCPAMVLLCVLVIGRLHSRMLRDGRRELRTDLPSVTVTE